jgi:putative chitinase
MITSEQLKKIAPVRQKEIGLYLDLYNQGFEKYKVNTKQRIAGFLSQVLHESGCWKYAEEIASGKAYEGRKDLGNIILGDGVRFKGRTHIQTTGRANYQKLSMFLFNDERLLEDPKLLLKPEYVVAGAFFYWTDNKLNDICDKPEDWTHLFKGKTYSKIQWLTKRVNGGQNGINERTLYYNKAKAVL